MTRFAVTTSAEEERKGWRERRTNKQKCEAEVNLVRIFERKKSTL